MRVVFISLFKSGFGGGEGQAAHELAQHFAPYHDTVLICPGDHTGPAEAENGLRVFAVQSATEGIVCLPALSAWNVNKILAFLDEFHPDVMHAHEPALIGLIGQIWARMHHVPFVYTAHVLPSKILEFGTADVVNARIMRSILAESVTRQILTNFFENCDALVALNDYALDSLRQFGHAGRIFVIPNGRELKRYAICKNTNLSSPKRVLTFVGFISERKNQRYLLEVLTHLPRHYWLYIVGEPLNLAYGQQLRDFCQAHGLDNVVFTGQVEHKAIPPYLEKTHVFVSASKMEVQSLVVIEALASGTPVVGLSNETVDELVDDQVGARLPKDTDPAEFARHVEQICNLPQPEYDRMCENARQRVKRLDWTNVVALTTQAYESLLSENPPVTQKASTGLANLIALLPPGEVRDILAERVTALERTIQEKVHLEPGASLASTIQQVRRVPASTWFFAGLTIPASVAGYLVLRSMTSVSHVKKSTDRLRLHGFRPRHWRMHQRRRPALDHNGSEQEP